ncbi:6-phosphofructo-2-kinase-domain-containing protein [Phycomyces nitens]|nr:6-phosphofructo-2-kinase-domain-containing protein [Phycomyces nitens]
MSTDRRRKTLPVVKTEHDIVEEVEQSRWQEEFGDEQFTLTAEPLTRYEDSPLEDPKDFVQSSNTSQYSSSRPNSPQPHWLQLSADVDETFLLRTRHSLGLDVPGAVHTIVPHKLKNERQLDSKLVIVMVGLPARGKSYLVKKLRRYLNWLQYETKIFNVGNTRREHETSQTEQNAKFFDPDNATMKQVRDELAMEVLENLVKWLRDGGRVAIHDATNSTLSRRKLLIDRLNMEPEIKVLMLESVCTDKNMLERNFLLKLSGPDYKGKDPAQALADFRSRVANYEKAYEPIGDWEEDNDIQYCKLINVGKKVIAYNISGYLPGQCIFYLMNFNLRQIFLTRHGESTDNVLGRIGGDAPFAKALARFIRQQRLAFALDMVECKKREDWRAHKANKSPMPSTPQEEVRAKVRAASNSQFTVWTSMLKRSTETGAAFDPDEYDVKHIRFLNEINSGCCEGLTYEDIQASYPEEFNARQANKLYYRYPGMGGESYIDVIHRLQSMIIELERMTQSCLIITHRVIMRILLGYLLDWTQTEMPHMMVPIHTVYEIRPKPYGTELKKWQYIEETDRFEEF